MRTILFVFTIVTAVAFTHFDGSVAMAGKATETAEKAPSSYTFAVIPYYTPEKIWTLFSPFVEYLRKTTGQPWKLKLYHNHDEFVANLCNGTISVALAGPIPLGRAYNTCGVKPILVALAKNGKPDYHSVIVTNDPSIHEVADLKGEKIGFFKGSTAAHIIPVKLLKNAGIPFSQIQPVFFESQDRIFSALMSGELAAGGMKESLYRKIEGNLLRAVAVSEPLPNFALCALPSLQEKVRASVVSSLLNLKPLSNKRDAETVKSWDDEVKNGFIEPPPSFLPAIINLYSTYWEVVNDTR